VATAGQVLGIGMDAALRLADEGRIPTRIRRIGRRYPVPEEGLLDLLETISPQSVGLDGMLW
jgi:predicted site-specific integrase-resolvase